jgi:hypothetical protein
MNDMTADGPKSSRAPKQVAEARSPADWAAHKETVAWAFAGAKQAMRDVWVIGRDVSEGDFDKAIDAVMNLRFGSHPATEAKRKRGGR